MPRQWKAIILAAGRGGRLNGITDDCPKPLLRVGGISIVERALHNLVQLGVEQTAIVVGYRARDIRRLLGDGKGAMRLTYLENPRFGETNTAYSLWVARAFLKGGCLLLEGDIVFEEAALKRILTAEGGSAWAGVSVTPGRNEGILLETDGHGRVVGCQLVRRPADSLHSHLYKCAGIQRLSPDLAYRFVVELEEVVRAGDLHLYADLALGRLLDVTNVHLCLLDGLKWAEVDDLEDLRHARTLFDEKPTGWVTAASEVQNG